MVAAKRLYTAVAALALLGAGFYLYQSANPPDSDGSTTSTAKPEKPVIDPQLGVGSDASSKVGNLPASGVQPANSDWTSSTLYREIGTERNLRVFVEKAKRLPQNGGIFYAAKALDECRAHIDGGHAALTSTAEKAAVSERDPAVRNQRADALRWTKERCQSFSKNELDILEARSLKSSREASIDQIWQVTQEAYKSSSNNKNDAAAMLAMASKIVATKEPGLLDTLKSVTATFDKNTHLYINYVDGVPNGGLDSEAFPLAWKLMECKVTDTCETKGAHDYYKCAYEGVCTDTTSDAIKAPSGKQFAQVQKVSDRLVQVIQQQDVGALVKK